MTKLNFQQFRIPTGIDKTQYRTGDARESVANMLYLNVNGIRAHALAMKIYRSEGAARLYRLRGAHPHRGGLELWHPGLYRRTQRADRQPT